MKAKPKSKPAMITRADKRSAVLAIAIWTGVWVIGFLLATIPLVEGFLWTRVGILILVAGGLGLWCAPYLRKPLATEQPKSSDDP